MYPKITLTCTSGRRYEMFKRTLDSFMIACLDKSLITRWIVFDDGSQELEQMKKEYPFIEFYQSRGGQPASLNDLFNKVETEYFFHIEDDWQFIKKGHFIKQCFDVMNDKIKNVVVKKWEPYTVKHLKWTEKGTRYVLHHYEPTGDIVRMEATDCNWMGWSLNPGLQHTPTVKRIMPFNESAKIGTRFWDRQPADKFMELGFKRASLCRDYVKHIGEDHTGSRSLYNIIRKECFEKTGCQYYPRRCEHCPVK